MPPFLEQRRHITARLGPLYTRIRYPDLFAKVSRLCLFIGHGRSGSTLVGALLNAHPNIVMSNELDVIDHLRHGLSQEQLLHLIYFDSLRHARRGSPGGGGYTYAVPDQWQGKHSDIRVVGDRKAGSTAIQLFRHPGLLEQLQASLRLALNFVCVVRNPFDTITTTFKKTPRLDGETAEEHLRRQIERYFERWNAIAHVAQAVGTGNIAFVYHEELIGDPSATLKKLCRFLDIPSDEPYLSACASVVRRDPHVTRTSIEWQPEMLDLVQQKCADVPWIRHYSY